MNKVAEMEMLEKERAARDYHAGQPVMACRDKTWNELGLEEKVERLRNVLRNVNGIAQNALDLAHAGKQLAEEHVHSPTGQVFKPVYGGANILAQPSGYSSRHDPLA